MIFCDINSGTNSTPGPRSRPARSKFQWNWAALWDNRGSESIRLIPIRPSHPNESPSAAEEPAWPLSRGVSACMSPPAILSGAFWRETQQTLCHLIWRGKGLVWEVIRTARADWQFWEWRKIPRQLKGRRRRESRPFQTTVSLSCCFNGSQTAKSR